MNNFVIYAWIQDLKGITDEEYRLLMCLASFRDDRKETEAKVYPFLHTLAERYQKSERQTQRVIAQLIKKKIIFRQTTKNQNGWNRYNNYYFNLGAVTYTTIEPIDNVEYIDEEKELKSGCHKCHQPGCQKCHHINKTKSFKKEKEKNTKKEKVVDKSKFRSIKVALNVIDKELRQLETARDSQRVNRQWTDKQEKYFQDRREQFADLQKILKDFENGNQ